MALRTYAVSFTGPSGLRHSVEVAAEQWLADAVAPGTELEVQVREPATSHRLTVQQIRR